ncbi:uncharacterized protein A4U43_C10F15660 [Asparagus officinalis]|uniref:DUF7811 domain-containing protein n=1 Tax=Asparagus officinalis TaxID=4686 RepID=A0A5P1E4W6_ASPOF|nr:uncharacterized protein LOC109826259 [Asparagus officinalis]ONK57013.1 uncharacterized protein A4U43_C10F15660 [Asparagus officinalis]
MTMADSSAALCFFSSPFHPLPSTSSCSPSSSKLSLSSRNLSLSPRCRSPPLLIVRSRGKDSDGGGCFGGGDPYGPYPWESSVPSHGDDQTIQWLPEDRITLFTTEGLIQIGGSLVPRRFAPSDKRKERLKSSLKLQRFQESDYMDPDQGLCLGALFDIAATNGLDTGRRLCIFGFCRSIEMLSDVVEDTVLEHGGEVVAAEKASKGGLQEKLKMTVAVPLLWGVPPASETLRVAVRSGGGIVEKIYWQWDFL